MSDTPKLTVLITGASRGVGLELVRQYSAKPDWQVIATCRNPLKAKALITLDDQLDNVDILALDVTSPESVLALARDLKGKAIDVLINNAGMYGPNAPLLPVDIDAWHQVFHVNCVAPVHIAQQLHTNLELGHLKKVVTISSDMGSIHKNIGGGAYLYRSSKSALNSAMYSLSLDLKVTGFTILMIHPGHVKTDMGGPNAKIEVVDSANGIIKLIQSSSIEDSGTFFDWTGAQLPW